MRLLWCRVFHPNQKSLPRQNPSLFLEFYLKDNNSSIEKVVLESKVGDILYCTLHYIDSKHRRYYSVCSIVDGLIMSILNKLNFYVVKETWDKIDPYDDWNYEEFIVDWTRE